MYCVRREKESCGPDSVSLAREHVCTHGAGAVVGEATCCAVLLRILILVAIKTLNSRNGDG